MTIEELRERKRVLLARKRDELELQARGEGDTLSLFMLNEELLDVNAKLRALAPAHQRKGPRGSGQDWSFDRQQYRDWFQEDQHEDEPNQDRAALLSALREGRTLTARQGQVLTLRTRGMGVKEIANHLGVNPSTISRTLKRAEEHIRRDGEGRLLARDGVSVDLSSQRVRDIVLRTLSPEQALYIYLYYSEWMSACEIGSLVGVCASTVSRVLRRGMARLDALFGGKVSELHGMDALDDVFLDLASQLKDGALVVSERKKQPRQHATRTSERVYRTPEPPKPTLRVFTGQRERVYGPRRRSQEVPSKHRFFAVLLELLSGTAARTFRRIKLLLKQQTNK